LPKTHPIPLPLECNQINGVASEINLLRVVLARNFGTGLRASPPDLHSQLLVLRTRADAASLIAALLRTQIMTQSVVDELELAIEQVFGEVDFFIPDDGA